MYLDLTQTPYEDVLQEWVISIQLSTGHVSDLHTHTHTLGTNVNIAIKPAIIASIRHEGEFPVYFCQV